MSHEVRSPSGRLLFTSEELQRALNPHQTHLQSRWPDWMRQLRWPTGMVEAFRSAWREKNNGQMAMILQEARLLHDAELKNLTTAAAAIRNQLNNKYGG